MSCLISYSFQYGHVKRRKATDRSCLQTEKIIFVDTQAYFSEKFQSLTDAFSFSREKNEAENVK